MPILTLVIRLVCWFSALLVCQRTRDPTNQLTAPLSPRRLPRRQRHASHPLSRLERPPPRPGHPHLRRPVPARRELAREGEPVGVGRVARLAVHVAQELFARRHGKLGERAVPPCVTEIPELREAFHQARLLLRLVAIAEQQ